MTSWSAAWQQLRRRGRRRWCSACGTRHSMGRPCRLPQQPSRHRSSSSGSSSSSSRHRSSSSSSHPGRLMPKPSFRSCRARTRRMTPWRSGSAPASRNRQPALPSRTPRCVALHRGASCHCRWKPLQCCQTSGALCAAGAAPGQGHAPFARLLPSWAACWAQVALVQLALTLACLPGAGVQAFQEHWQAASPGERRQLWTELRNCVLLAVAGSNWQRLADWMAAAAR